MPFKIDTGADVSVMPENCFKLNFSHQLGKTQKRLYAAGMAMPVLGNFQATLEANGKVSHEEIYVIKNFPVSLLSAKASEELGFIQRLLHVNSNPLTDPLKDYPELFSGLGKLNKPYKIELNDQAQPYAIHTHTQKPLLRHTGLTEDSPWGYKTGKPMKVGNKKWRKIIYIWRIPFPLMNKTKQKLKEMEQQGVIEKVDHATDWCSPMLSNGKVFSKLDANSGFWQIPLDDKSKDFTTFLTPFGRYRFCRPPFGITSAPKHFQKRMNEVLRDIAGSMCHLDDIIVWGSNQQEHDGRLKQVLSKLKETGLTLNKEKCPDEKKIRAINEKPSPQNVTELKRFLGMINYLSRFIPSLAERAHPLYSLLSQKNDSFWGDNQVKAFETLKKALSSFPTLAMYNPSYKTFITTDASSFGLGAYLSQINGKNQRQIIAYASRSLSETERKYAQIEKEALALTWAMDKFKNYIISLEVELETDHKPLISIFSTKALEDFFSKNTKNEVTHDAVLLQNQIYSWKEEHSGRYVSDKWIKEIAVHQSKDPTIQRVKSYVQDHWPDKSKLSQKEVEFWHVRNDLIIINNLLMKGSRYVVPGSLRSEILSRIHEGHQGVTKCRRMRESFYWPKSYKDVEQMVLNCNECIKKSSSWKEPIIMTGFSDRPWKEVAMDLCQFEGKHFLVITDYYSCYPEFSRLDNLSAETVILHTKSIFAGHGIPKLVRMDNGLQFKNYLFQNFEKRFGFRHIMSSPKYLQSNGMAESSVKMIKARLKKSQDPYLGLLAYRTTPLENGFSPSELLMGRKLRTDLPTHPDLLKPTLVNQGLLNQKEHKYRC
ncbi:K02A2.6-like [Cordylochernes scorpioides]|uniref:RNA-directed DNA polymerase n=1 Tax=Cordylochernes scorpioides TaxID=51811 RepID=A0ABY6LBG6_9ARAC|nr:K02A2.6-like [Cordylochernes scorpioides]